MNVLVRNRRGVAGELADNFFQYVFERDQSLDIAVLVDYKREAAPIALEVRNWPQPRWSISPLLRYTDNSSNVALLKFNRAEAMVYLKYSFD